MKASELIKRLKSLKKEHGDLPVRIYDFGEIPVSFVGAYNENGNQKRDDGNKETHIAIM